jgi:hypothetical protein
MRASQVMDQGAIEIGQPGKVKLLQRLGGSELRPAQPGTELLLIPLGHLVTDEQSKELGIGKLRLNGLAVACGQRIQNARQAQGFQLRG